ncbi:MAG: divalent-cation tolerance protein CutA [Balneolaceae bacterium]
MFYNLRLIYITAKNREEAKSIGSVLVEEKLAACVNIIDGMETIYRWKGSIETGKECILIAKTGYGKVELLTKRVKELHSYEVPCVISLKVAEQEGNIEYLEWLIGSVRNPKTMTHQREDKDS